VYRGWGAEFDASADGQRLCLNRLVEERDEAPIVLIQNWTAGDAPRMHCPFLAPLRPLPRFAGILAKAQERVEAFRKSENERVPSSTPTGETR